MRQSINSEQYSLNISQILSAFTEEFLKQENQDQQIRQLDSVISTESASNNDLLLKIVEGTRFFEDYEIKDRRSREELKQYTEQLLKLLSSYHDYLLLILDSKEQDSSHITSIKSLVPNGHFHQRLLEVQIDDFSKLISTVKNITFLFNKLILDFEKARSMAPDQLKDTVEKISLILNIFPGNIPFACLDGLQSSLVSTIKSLNPKSTLEKIVQDKFDTYTSQVGSIVLEGDERHCQSFLIDVLSLKDHSATLRTIDAFYINLYSSTKLALIFSIAEDLNHNKFFTQLLSGYQKYYDELPTDLREANISEESELLTPQQLQKLDDAIEDVKDNFSLEDCEEFGLNDTFSFFNSDGGTIMTPQQLNQKLIKDICKKYSEKYPHFFDQEKVDFFKHLPSKESLFYSQDSDYLDPEKMSILFELFQRIEDGDEPEIKKQKLDKAASGLFLLREIIKNTNTFDISQTQSNRSRVNFYSICFFSNFAIEKGFEFLKLFYEDESLSKIRDEYQQLSPILDFFKKEILKIEREEALIRSSLGNEAKYLEFKEIFLQGNYSERNFDSSEIRALKQQKRERFRRFATSELSQSELNQQALLSIIKMLVDSGNSQALGELLSELSITEFLTINLENSAIYNQEIIKTLCQFFCAQEEIGAEELTELKSILINADSNIFETALSIKRADVAEDLLAFLEQDICNLASKVAIKMLTIAFEYEKPNLVTKILEILTRPDNSISGIELEAFFRAIDYNNGGTLIHSLILTNNKEGLKIILEFLSNKRMLGILNLQNQLNETPLILTADLGNIDIIKMLLEREVDEFDVNSSNDRGLTALHLASENGHQEIVKLLLTKGANVNLSTNTGATPLYIAAQNGHTEAIKALIITEKAEVDLAEKNGWTPLLIASQNGHQEIVKLLLEKKANVNLVTNEGATALHLASQNGHKEVVELLLRNEATVDLVANNGATALHLASKNGHQEIVESLLINEATVDLVDNEGLTALHLASQNGHSEAIKTLIERGATVDKAKNDGATPLYVASYNGHSEAIKLLIERGANVDLARNDGWTPLLLASEKGHSEAIKLLIEAGAKVDLAANDGATPLYVASQNGHSEAIKLLIEAGAKVDLAQKDDATPLYVASQNGHSEAIKLLIEAGAKVDLAINGGATALHLASKNGHKEVVELLLRNGATVDLVGSKGITAFHLASEDGHQEIVKLLLEKKANVNLVTNEGATALHLASQNGHKEVVELLLKKGATVDLVGRENFTALHLASQQGHKEIVELLLKKGATVDLVGRENFTALHLASQQGHKEIVELLLKKGATVDLVGRENFTALHLASQQGHADIARILEFFSNLQHYPLQHSRNSEDALKLFGEKVDFMQDLEKSIKRDQLTPDLTTASEINPYKQELEKQLITRLALLKLYSYVIGTRKFPALSKEQKIEIIGLGNSQLHNSLRDFYDLVDNPDLKAIIDKTPQELIILAKQISTKITYRITSDGNSVGEFSEDRARQDATEILRNICRKSLATEDLGSGNSLIFEIISEIIQQQNQNPDTTLSRGSFSRFKFSIINSQCIVS